MGHLESAGAIQSLTDVGLSISTEPIGTQSRRLGMGDAYCAVSWCARFKDPKIQIWKHVNSSTDITSKLGNYTRPQKIVLLHGLASWVPSCMN